MQEVYHSVQEAHHNVQKAYHSVGLGQYIDAPVHCDIFSDNLLIDTSAYIPTLKVSNS
jgi:Ser/Thr protein kinase RdoA (MazF antagonist)